MGVDASGGTAPRRRLRIGMAVVVGDSMRPSLRPGDRLVVLHGRRARVGAVVVARFPDGTDVVKRVAQQRPSGWWLLSDNPSVGVDSRHRGAVADDRVQAVVVGRLWPRPAIRV